jgi:capsular polysaccharide biosynthesis protein
MLLFIGGGIAGGIALALFLSAASDIRAGRIVERWQVEQQLELPVLSEIQE